MFQRIARAVFAAALLSLGAGAQAQYPNKAVKIIVPYPAGQATDIAARIVGDALAKEWGQAVVIENIGGGMAIPTTVGEVGNFPLEDLVAMLDEMGVKTGLDPRKVIEASKEISKRLGIRIASHRATGCTREDVMRAGAESPKNPQVTA